MASLPGLPVHRDIELQAVTIVQYPVADKAATHGVLDYPEHDGARVDIARDDFRRRLLARVVIWPYE